MRTEDAVGRLNTFKRSLALVAFALVLVAWTQAPDLPGELFGIVTGPSGTPLAGVTVTVAGPALPQPRSVVTDAAGAYRVSRVPAGTFAVRFASPGFFPLTQQSVVVGTGAPVGLNVKLASTGPGGAQASGTSSLTSGEVLVRLETSSGAIDIAVDTAHAPVTSANFLKYVDAGLYKGGRFYRVTRADNYTPSSPDRPLMEIIQGGIDPARTAEAFPAIPLERTSVTGLKNVVGVVSMARGSAADTATSEFFILLNDQPSLDFGGRRFTDAQGAAAFGRIVAGLDVVRKIQQQPAQGDRLSMPVAIVSAARVK